MYKIIKKIINFFKKKKLKYPSDFGLITYTESALNLGVQEDANKVIIRYKRNKYGNTEIRRYDYCEERVEVLRNQGVPIYDKTAQEITYPIFSKILPGEISFKA